MPDPMFESLYQEADKLRWPSPGGVRRRGQQARQRRLVALAAVTAFLVLAGGTAAALAAGQREPAVPPATAPPTESPTAPATPSPSPSSTQSPSPPATGGLPAAAMLQPEDLPPGSWTGTDDADGDWTFFASTIHCDFSQPPGPTGSSTELRERAYFDEAQFDVHVSQQVHRYRAGDAGTYLADIRAIALACTGPDGGSVFTIVDEEFAGDESVLIRAEFEGDAWTHHIFVRQGDLVAEVWAKPAPDQEGAIRLAQRAADRLCAATAC